MNVKRVIIGLSGILSVVLISRVHATQDHDQHNAPVGLVKEVRDATKDFRDVKVAMGPAMRRSAAASLVGERRDGHSLCQG